MNKPNIALVARQKDDQGALKIPAEGENGVFTQSWYAMAWSSDVPPGKVVGRDFLDGRIVIFRGADGRIAAMSAYCPHVGADLSVGEVVGNELRCAFHHWQYSADGLCTKTGIGDKPPPGACLFVFPTVERYGIVFVFNGEEPLFDVPSFPYPDSELEIGIPYPSDILNCDPWVFCANTPDMQHLKFVHRTEMAINDHHDKFVWDDFGFKYNYRGTYAGDVPVDSTSSIRGTSIFYRSQMLGDFWRGSMVGFGIPSPGKLCLYSINAVRKGPNAKEQLETSNQTSLRIFSEDRDIMNTVHYRPRNLTRTDQSLAKFLRYVRNYPRAHPSASFIR